MLISIKTHLVYFAAKPCDLLLQIEALDDAAQVCTNTKLTADPDIEWRIIDGEEKIGKRRWGRVTGTFDCTYQTQVRVDRPTVAFDRLNAAPLTSVPSEITKFLMPSRYCFPEDFLAITASQFQHLSGGALIQAMSDWIEDNFTYDNGASMGSTTATETFAVRAGVCRDYAHVLIAMARVVGIPARIVSAYAAHVVPQDFHAVVDVYLDGEWHLIDPTGMTKASEIVRIGVGRDAADVSFMTSYGAMELKKQSVNVTLVD